MTYPRTVPYEGPAYTAKSPAHVDKDLVLYSARVVAEANPVTEAMEYALADHPGGWMARGACARHASPDLWFSDPHGRAARRSCNTCPVRNPCRAYALDLAARGVELSGIWGGLDPDQRAELAHQPRRTA